MKSIVGRLSDLGLGELFRLLDTVGASGTLEVESSAGKASLRIRGGQVAGEPVWPLVQALAARSGTFCFRPQEVGEDGQWRSAEEFVARIEELAAERSAQQAASAERLSPSIPDDPLAELRSTLAEVTIPETLSRILVFAADPRPYRALAASWEDRGWQSVVLSEPRWPEGLGASLVVLHLPSSATLAGQGDLWLSLIQRATVANPPVPVIWVGGLTDPWLRHQAIVHGAEFLLPAPAGEVGEAARWFREEVSLLVERLLERRAAGGEGEAAAFRELFVALHTEASGADARASLLRFAGRFFARGFLLAVRDANFELLGAYGLSCPVSRLPRGQLALEDVVASRRAARLADRPKEEGAELAALLGLPGVPEDGAVYPLVAGGEAVALFLADGRLPEGGDDADLRALLARSGSLLGL